VAEVIYRLMAEPEAPAVCGLVARSFGEFVAPDYSPEGVAEFLRFATPAAMLERLESGGFVLNRVQVEMPIAQPDSSGLHLHQPAGFNPRRRSGM